MADIVGDEKEALLAETAAVGAAAGGAAEVGDFRTYLGAYYRHVALEDLTAAGPERLAATAIEQAKLAAYRPQGRALVRVRRGQAAACAASRDVVDIVTDDMPFLVDSIRMELTRHDVTTHLVVHPQFLIKRNVAGELHEVVGVIDGERQAHDEIAESWTHVEVSRLPDGEGAKLERDLERVLSDVRVAVEDWHRMQARAVQLAEQLAMSADGGAPASDESPAEVEALLRWLADGHFTFLGYREYDLLDGPDGMALRGVPGTGLGILRHDRPSYLDYVAVKRLDPSGKVTGEYRFLGLYTHDAYTESITRIPVLRRKLTEMLAAFGFAAGGHDGKDLAEFMENYPREDLFQTTVAQLVPVAEGVLRLRERTQPRLFLRKDIYGRYMSCLLYLARDRYTTQVRLRTQEILRKALDGASTDYSVMVGETPLARLHIVVRAGRGQLLPDVDSAKLEAEVAAAIRSWDDDFAEEAVCQLGEERGQAVLAVCGGEAIPPTYKTDVPASVAVDDLEKVLKLRESGESVAFDLWESESYVGGVPIEDSPAGEHDPGDDHRVWRLSIYRTGSPITLTDVLPRLQHMGVDVVDEHPYEFEAAEPFWIYDFGLRRSSVGADASARTTASVASVKDLVQDA